MSRYCQFGEQEIIDRFLRDRGIMYKVCCDIGARLDGSNVAHLMEQGWKGVLVDANPKHAQVLKTAFPEADVRHLTATIENVNDIVPDECDVLSIDIDSNDWWIWAALSTSPRMVIVETNGRPGFDVAPYTNREYKGGAYGGSSDAMDVLAKAKGYVFYDRTGVNNVYIRKGE